MRTLKFFLPFNSSLKTLRARIWVFYAILLIVIPATNLLHAAPTSSPHRITFINESGQNAHVKLIGPTRTALKIYLDQKRSVRVDAGEYYVLIRYGNSPKEYTYTKGDPFSVTQSGDQYSRISITLHRVISGSHTTGLVSGDEFENAVILNTK